MKLVHDHSGHDSIYYRSFMYGLSLFLILFLVKIQPANAQDNLTEYRWDQANIALRYPTNWDEPLAVTNENETREILLMAQNSVGTDVTNRPPGIPILDVHVISDATADTDLYGLMELELVALQVRPIGPLPATLLDKEAIATNGTDRDNALYGMGRIVFLEESQTALLMVGRASNGQRESFTTLFNQVAASIVIGSSRLTTAPEYGVFWYTDSAPMLTNITFWNIQALTLSEDTLALVDARTGIVMLERISGSIIDHIPIDESIQPSDIAMTSDGLIYLADSACQCIRIFSGEREVDQIEGFGLNSPQSIALGSDGTLYATDQNENIAMIHVIKDGTDNPVIFEFPLYQQPILTVDRSGKLLILVDNQVIYSLEEQSFVPLSEFETGPFLVSDMTVDDENNVVISTMTQGILIFDGRGNEVNRVGRIVAGFPQAGELVSPQGVAAASDGTIYWADSDGTFGNVTAVSLAVEAGRIGATNLTPGLEVGSEFVSNKDADEHIWTFDGLTGEQVTLTANANPVDYSLNLALRLVGPDGEEVAFVDDEEEGGTMYNPYDPQIHGLELKADGQYTVIVERVFGIGSYTLGLSKSEKIELVEGRAEVEGALSSSVPLKQWIVEARGGQSLTVTMLNANGSLDPVVILYDTRGEIIDQNDDALDPAMAFNAQLADVPIPLNGEYVIEATRFFGEGEYILQILVE